MYTIIFGLTKERAINKLNEIESFFKNSEIKSRWKYGFELFNGDYYKAEVASETSRGYKCNVLYVDSEISLKLFHNVIKYCIYDEKDIYLFGFL